jgi:hypothetical protein
MINSLIGAFGGAFGTIVFRSMLLGCIGKKDTDKLENMTFD